MCVFDKFLYGSLVGKIVFGLLSAVFFTCVFKRKMDSGGGKVITYSASISAFEKSLVVYF